MIIKFVLLLYSSNLSFNLCIITVVITTAVVKIGVVGLILIMIFSQIMVVAAGIMEAEAGIIVEAAVLVVEGAVIISIITVAVGIMEVAVIMEAAAEAGIITIDIMEVEEVVATIIIISKEIMDIIITKKTIITHNFRNLTDIKPDTMEPEVNPIKVATLITAVAVSTTKTGGIVNSHTKIITGKNHGEVETMGEVDINNNQATQ